MAAADLLDEKGKTDEAIRILVRLEAAESTSGLAASANTSVGKASLMRKTRIALPRPRRSISD